MKNFIKSANNQRVVTFLNRGEVDFLDKLGKDALFSTGAKLSRAKLIAWLVDFMKELNISGKGIKSIKDLEKRIKIALEGNLTKLIIILILLFSFRGAGLAQDYESIGVAFSIPAIPGINVPLDEHQKDEEISENDVSLEKPKVQENNEEQSLMILETTEKEIQKNNGETQLIVLETIYSR